MMTSRVTGLLPLGQYGRDLVLAFLECLAVAPDVADFHLYVVAMLSDGLNLDVADAACRKVVSGWSVRECRCARLHGTWLLLGRRGLLRSAAWVAWAV